MDRRQRPAADLGLSLTYGKMRCLWGRDLPQIKCIMRDGQVFGDVDVKGITKMMANYLENPDGDELRTFVCSIKGEISGFVVLGKDMGEDTWEIFVISVSPKYQGNGLGKRMIRYAEDHIRHKGGRIIFISTSTAKDYGPARRLYRRCGYTQTAKLRDFFYDGDHRIILQKRLRKVRRGRALPL